MGVSSSRAVATWVSFARASGPRSRSEQAAVLASAVAVGSSFEPGLLPRSTSDQVLVTSASALTALSVVTMGASVARLAGNVAARVARRGNPLDSTTLTEPLVQGSAAVFPTAVALVTKQLADITRRAISYDEAQTMPESPRQSVVVAAGVGVGTVGVQALERAAAGAVGRRLHSRFPGYDVEANVVGHAAPLVVAAGVLAAGYVWAARQAERAATVTEPAYATLPETPYVTGGPGSAVPFATLAREGRRFTSKVLSREEIAQVMGEPAKADPIRAFVGLPTAPTVAARVAILMAELERMGAFERDLLVLVSPTGSGYINYVAAEAVEYLTLGSSAIVGVGYSVLPSLMSMRQTELAVVQNRAVLDAVTARLRAIPEHRRPRLVVYGESLGANTMQDVWCGEGVPGLQRDGVAAALFLGTPAAGRFAREWRAQPQRMDPHSELIEVDSLAEYQAVVAARSGAGQGKCGRYVLLTHHDDPVAKFERRLMVRKPGWLGAPASRPQGVPKSPRWWPGTTFMVTAADVVNATSLTPGHFSRRGHDYREDIAPFVSAVYELHVTDAQMASVETAMREREKRWAAREADGGGEH